MKRPLLITGLIVAVVCVAMFVARRGGGKPPAADGAAKTVLRIGYFPNVTHAQGIIGRTLSAEGRGWFEERLGPDVEIQWYVYNAGPSAMEAIFTDSIDLTYVGPNPALNAYIRARGEDIRIVSGAARGGAALLVRPDAGIAKPEDFRGKKLATPQFGNTQDVAARAWLKAQGFRMTQLSGDVFVIPTANPDQLSMFQQGQIDAVWTVEPWVSRIENEAGGVVYLEQPDVVTTVLVASEKSLTHRRELIGRFVKAHHELTNWIVANPAGAQAIVQRGLTSIVHREVPLEVVANSWRRLTFASDISLSSIEGLVADARGLGFIRGSVDLIHLIELPQ